MKNNSDSILTRRVFLLGAVVMAAPVRARAAAREIEVWKSPTCGCCSAWIAHLEGAGFSVLARDLSADRLAAVKDRMGVPDALRSCHTARIGEYVIEGHVPASDIELLLSFSPDISGLAVPGMPIGSPGMEMGDETEPYATVAFGPDGPVGVFARHGG